MFTVMEKEAALGHTALYPLHHKEPLVSNESLLTLQMGDRIS